MNRVYDQRKKEMAFHDMVSYYVNKHLYIFQYYLLLAVGALSNLARAVFLKRILGYIISEYCIIPVLFNFEDTAN